MTDQADSDSPPAGTLRGLFAFPGSTEEGTGGSSIRPARLLAAFRRVLGSDAVDLVDGPPETFGAKIRNVDVGRLDFAYFEVQSSPVFITLRRRPLAIVRYLAFVRRVLKAGVPSAVFVRDRHWNFPDLIASHPRWARAGALLANLELWFYREAAVVYLPSKSMAELLPSRYRNRVAELPPGSAAREITYVAPQPGEPIQLVYSGGVSPPLYDLASLCGVAKAPGAWHLTIATPRELWASLPDGPRRLTDDRRISVVHPSRVDLDRLLGSAHAAIVDASSHPYLAHAYPVKASEAISFMRPIIAIAGSHMGEVAESEGIGWAVTDFSNLDRVEADLRSSDRVRLISAALQRFRALSTWDARVQTVLTDLIADPPTFAP